MVGGVLAPTKKTAWNDFMVGKEEFKKSQKEDTKYELVYVFITIPFFLFLFWLAFINYVASKYWPKSGLVIPFLICNTKY